MNKKIILPFVAILVLAVAMVGAASADEVTTVDKIEVRGNVANATDAAAGITWDAHNFAAFWYDLDDDLQTESLVLNATEVSDIDRTIDENKLTYITHPEYQEYELYKDKGLVVEGDSKDDLDTGYYIEGWLAEKYVAVNNNPDKLVKLLVEFEGDDKKTLSTGEAWDLGSGFTLTAQQIDLEGDKVWLSLEKDGKELDSEVLATGGIDKNDSVYTYTEDLASEDDVPVFSCFIDAVFRGTDSNIVQVKYVFLIDNDVLEIKSGDTFGVMEAKVHGTYIELKNEEDTLDLSDDTTEHIMGNMYFKTADDDADKLRFYPMVEYTEPGTYEIRGNVANATDAAAGITWDAHNFAAFWYDLDDDLQTESLVLNATEVSDIDRTIDENKLTYITHPEYQEYELYKDKGLVVEGDSKDDLDTGYYIEGWLAEKYVAVNNNPDKLVKLLVEFEGDDKKTLSTGEAWDLGSGFTLTAQQIDLEGDKVWLSLEKDGKELDSEVLATGGIDKNDSVYTYTEDLASEDDVPVFSCFIDAVFRGTDSNIVQVKYVFLIDNDVLEIKSGDTFGVMEAKVHGTYIELKNEEDTLDLSDDTTEHIMGNMYFKTADDDADKLRFYPFVEYTIGEGAAGEAEEEETPTDANETADVNVTPTAVVTPTAEPTASPEVTATAEDTTAAEETATKKKTPGFEAIFAIAGLLAVAYLVLRQRE